MEPVTSCPYCHERFTLEDLVCHPGIVPIGMMLNDSDARWNFYYFNHVVPGCETTFTVEVEAFASLLGEPVPAAIRTFSCDCEGRCTSLADLAACKADCHWAPYRRFLDVLLARRLPTRA
ncbi:MAG TPA: hypothetical protein PLQ13_00940 [Candidatus Krumholzibacteria bacterium]|nr:hypothetical protein [Candidatus Krumholzibacteria bacterium]